MTRKDTSVLRNVSREAKVSLVMNNAGIRVDTGWTTNEARSLPKYE